jgi:hypothetical protein
MGLPWLLNRLGRDPAYGFQAADHRHPGPGLHHGLPVHSAGLRLTAHRRFSRSESGPPAAMIRPFARTSGGCREES